MARTFWDGADVYSQASDIAVKWQVYQNVFFAAGRFGEQAFDLGNTTGNGKICRTIDATDRHSIGSAIKLDSFTRPNMLGAGFFTTTDVTNLPTNRQVGWCVDIEGRLIVYRGQSTVLWQSVPGVVVNGAFIYIGFSAIIHPTAGSFSISANGFLLEEQTNINTRGQGDDSFTNVSWGIGNIASPTAYIVDDIYFDDEYLSLVPERRIKTRRAIADGTNLDLIPSTGTDHYPVIDETLLNATDYLSGSLPGEYDEFILDSLGNVPTVIDGVQACGYALKTDAATRAVNYGVRSNATDALGPDIPLGTSIQQGFNNVLLDPDGGVAWDAAAVDASRLLVRIAV